MNRYNINELNVKLDDIKLEYVNEITGIKIDRKKPNKERILKLLVKVKKLTPIRYKNRLRQVIDDRKR